MFPNRINSTISKIKKRKNRKKGENKKLNVNKNQSRNIGSVKKLINWN